MGYTLGGPPDVKRYQPDRWSALDHLARHRSSDAGSSRRAHVAEMHHQHGGYGCDVLAIAASVDTGYVGASLAFGGGRRVEVFME